MEKEKALHFLNTYSYNYSEKNNVIVVNLEFSHQVIIEFKELNKIIIKDRLVSWNFLTGIISMSLKHSLIYNFVGTALLGFIHVYLEKTSNGINTTPVLLIITSWIILFTSFYLIKLESFKNQIINWTK
jgi:hypothetical protein